MVKAYISIARPDHWSKNAFMLLGVIFALFIEPYRLKSQWYVNLVLALVSTCMIASINYVINEILDAPTDRFHSRKKYRPIPSGQVFLTWAYGEWLLLALSGFGIGFRVNPPFLTGFFANGSFRKNPPDWPKNGRSRRK
jgi:decaprenyl-phosphate phosphoribosyltransferase